MRKKRDEDGDLRAASRDRGPLVRRVHCQMTMKHPIKIHKLGLAVTAFGLALSFVTAAHACKDGEGRGAHHFEKKDTNGDGFLTRDEVGAERWDRIKVADANGDSKVSKDEMKKAREDGKLRKRGKHRERNKTS
jgi:hypothetical protein